MTRTSENRVAATSSQAKGGGSITSAPSLPATKLTPIQSPTTSPMRTMNQGRPIRAATWLTARCGLVVLPRCSECNCVTERTALSTWSGKFVSGELSAIQPRNQTERRGLLGPRRLHLTGYAYLCDWLLLCAASECSRAVFE